MNKLLRISIIALCILLWDAKAYATIYDWTGAISADWSNPANWKSTTAGITTNPAATYPGSLDTARIGVIALTNTSNFPVISAGGATSVGNIVWGTENYLTVSLVVNTAFTVNGNIENTATVQGNGNVSAYVFNLSGTGTLNVTGALVIGYDDGFTPLNPGNNNTFTFNSSLNQFTVLGGVNLNAYQGDTHHRGFLPSLNITGGTMTTSSIQSSLVNSNIYNSTLLASVTVGNSSGTPTAKLQLTGANALPAFSPYIVNTLTFNNPGATVEYSGASQTVYTDASIANLSNTVSYYNLKFSGSGVKTASGGNLNVAGDFNNTLANDGSNRLSLSALGSPSSNAVNFNGTTQNLQGGDGSGTTFYNVNFTNSGTKTMSSGTFDVADVGILTMSGTNTQLAAGNKILTLRSDSISTATVAAIPSGCSITGTVNVERFIKGSPTNLSKRAYRLISSTVYTGTVSGVNVYDINYLLNSVLVSGTPGGGFNASPFTNPSTYLYREDIIPSDANFTTGFWKGIAKINNANAYDIGTQKRLTQTNIADTTINIPVANGVLFFFRGNKNNNGTTAGTKTTVPYNYPESVVTTQVGTLNTGTVNFKIWFANAANGLGSNLSYTTTIANTVDRGFTLVGNPYASTINWEKYNRNSSPTKSSIYGSNGLGSTIYMLNATTRQFEAYMQKAGTISTADTTTNLDPGTAVGSASNMIASGQGFFVRASAIAQTLSFRETAKTNTQPLVAKMNNLMGKPKETLVTAEPLLRLQMIKDAFNNDEIVIRLDDNASMAYLPAEDAEDMGGLSPVECLSAISSDQVKLCISTLPFPKKTADTISLYIDATRGGNYQLKLAEIRDLRPVYGVWLIDNFAHDSVDMRSVPVYTFSIDKRDSSTFGNKRFQLVINKNQKAPQLTEFNAIKTKDGSLVKWNAKYEYDYTTYYIERSTDNGNSYQQIGLINSDGRGNYTFLDKKPVVGQDDYRLQQIDMNNDISFSKPVTLTYSLVTNSVSAVSIYPNPASNTINLTVNQNMLAKASYNIRITSSSGILVRETTSQQSTWKGNISNLQPGTYMVQVTDSQNKGLVGITSFVKD